MIRDSCTRLDASRVPPRKDAYKAELQKGHAMVLLRWGAVGLRSGKNTLLLIEIRSPEEVKSTVEKKTHNRGCKDVWPETDGADQVRAFERRGGGRALLVLGGQSFGGRAT